MFDDVVFTSVMPVSAVAFLQNENGSESAVVPPVPGPEPPAAG